MATSLNPYLEQYVLISPDSRPLFHELGFHYGLRSDFWSKPMKVLHIDSSILGDNSASRLLSREIVSRLTAKNPQATVQYLDLAAEALPHFSGGSLAQTDKDEAARNAQTLEDFLA